MRITHEGLKSAASDGGRMLGIIRELTGECMEVIDKPLNR
jgi:hypothetical protein